MSTLNINGSLTGLWVSVSELARERGVDKAAVSRRVKRLEAQGLLATQNGPGGSKLINLAEFDKVTGETIDLVRATNGVSRVWPFKQSDLVLSKEQARRAAYDADLKELELLERQGKLVLIERVEEATIRFAENVVRKIDQFPTLADETASAIARNGANGARGILQKIADDLCSVVRAEGNQILVALRGGIA
jgi:DNA-binding transcriptional ArsR family regulator